MMPNFTMHYNQGYTITPSTGRVSCQSGMASVLNMTPTLRIKHKKNAVTIFDAERFANALQQGLGSEILIHEEIARIKEPRFVERTLSDNFTPIAHNEIFAPIEEMKATIREAGGWDSYWVKQSLATHNFLASALGFEPTDHSDAPPYISATPTTKPQPCVDFGFEPTEASE